MSMDDVVSVSLVGRAHISVALGMACAFLILGMAGCTTLSPNEIRDAVVAKREQRKQEQCECTPQPHPGIIVIINEDS